MRVFVEIPHGFFVAPDYIVDHPVEELANILFQFSFRIQLQGSFDECVIVHKIHQSFLNDEPRQNHFVEGYPLLEPLPP
jgi:hypothetical protein